MNSGTMNPDKHIEQLLSRFLDGISTLEEEAQLATYFRTQQVPDEWQVYQDMFALFDRGEVEVQREEDKYQGGREKTPKRYAWRWAAAAAAIILLALTLPRLFKDPVRQDETSKLIAKADSTRTQRIDSTATDKGIPEHVIREIEHIKYKTPRHLMAQNTGMKQNHSAVKNAKTDEQEIPTESQSLSEQKRKRTIEDYIDTDPPQDLCPDFNGLTAMEVLAIKAQQDEEDLQDIRRRGKQLEKMMAVIPDFY